MLNFIKRIIPISFLLLLTACPARGIYMYMENIKGYYSLDTNEGVIKWIGEVHDYEKCATPLVIDGKLTLCNNQPSKDLQVLDGLKVLKTYNFDEVEGTFYIISPDKTVMIENNNYYTRVLVSGKIIIHNIHRDSEKVYLEPIEQDLGEGSDRCLNDFIHGRVKAININGKMTCPNVKDSISIEQKGAFKSDIVHINRDGVDELYLFELEKLKYQVVMRYYIIRNRDREIPRSAETCNIDDLEDCVKYLEEPLKEAVLKAWGVYE